MYASFNAQKIAHAYGSVGRCILLNGDILDLESTTNNSAGVDLYVEVKSKGELVFALYCIKVITFFNCFREEKSSCFGVSVAHYCCTLILFWSLLCTIKANKPEYDFLSNDYQIPH